MLPPLLIQAYVNWFLVDQPTAPGGVVMSLDRLVSAVVRPGNAVLDLAAVNHGFLFWLPGRFHFWTDPTYAPAAAALATAALLVPIMLLAKKRESVFVWCQDVRIVGAGLLIAMPVFLWTCGLVGSYTYVRDARYYEPLRPLAVFIAYDLAASAAARRRFSVAALAHLSRAYLLAFIVATAVEVAFIFVPTASGDAWRRALVGGQFQSWPSRGLVYQSSSARAFVLDLMQREPDARLITTLEHWFFAEPNADRSRIQRWQPCAALRATHIDGPLRVLILVEDRGEPPREVQWSGDPEREPNCLKLHGLELIRRFPDEQLKVLSAAVPDGVRVPLRN
jgi:hypothetical protein